LHQSNVNNKSGFEFKSSDVTEEELLASASNQSVQINDNFNRLFHIQSKFLCYDNEMVRMFGAKIVQSERQKTTNRNDAKFNFKNRIASHKATWPPFQKSGRKFLIFFACLKF
jgi:ABC-type oligopeptide transport system ATPase subunit